jgi:hypothetical protein
LVLMMALLSLPALLDPVSRVAAAMAMTRTYGAHGEVAVR